jgi:hypothetical protein
VTPEDDSPPPARSSAGCLLMIIPLSLLVLVLVAYVALYAAGMKGRVATGPRVAMVFETCEAARPLLEARTAAMGLGEVSVEPTATGLVVRARLPEDPSVAASIPGTLARPGALEVLSPEGTIVVPAGTVEQTAIHMGTTGALTLVQLRPEAAESLQKHMQQSPESRIIVRLDGETLVERKNHPAEAGGRLEIGAPGDTEAAQVRVAADRSIILGSGPLPCPTRALESRPLP